MIEEEVLIVEDKMLYLCHDARSGVDSVVPSPEPFDNILTVKDLGFLIHFLHDRLNMFCDHPPSLHGLHLPHPQLLDHLSHVQRLANVDSDQVTGSEDTGLTVTG